ncbi:MAG: NAD(+) synthase [Thermoguttaceae bacterium]|nr:NAD(+) synthase [Thermoguttaceae bacterium]
MLRNWAEELEARVAWIRKIIGKTETAPGMGIVYGNSGGKDCTLAAILCRKATDKILGVIMPCQSSVNFGTDREHALLAAKQFGIPTFQVDLSDVKALFLEALTPVLDPSTAPELTGTARVNETAFSPENAQKAIMNMNPRLRMTTLYALAQARGALVCGTGNRSEMAMGYFTKWGDGAFDFDPIADLTATEVFEFLRFLGAPREIIEKAPSAGLFEGQTDEDEMGIRYAEIDEFLLYGTGDPEKTAKVQRVMNATAHKRQMPPKYGS